MKELTLLLVLANLGFLAWGLWLSPEEAPRSVTTAPAASEVTRLVLLSELPGAHSTEPQSEPVNADGAIDAPSPGADDAIDAGEPMSATIAQEVNARLVTSDAAPPGGASARDADVEAVATTAEVDTTAPAVSNTVALIARPPAPRCASIGPFLDLSETAEAAARLRERGYTPSQRLADSPVWVGNWVYLGPFTTREAAVSAAESLRASGVTDIYVEPTGEQQNTVSLGLFSDRERAETLASAVRKLGVTPQINDRYRVASVYWVDVVVPPNVKVHAADYQPRPGRVVQVEEHECADGTTPGIVAERVPNG